MKLIKIIKAAFCLSLSMVTISALAYSGITNPQDNPTKHLRVSAIYSNQFGPLGDLKWTNYILNPLNAFTFEFAFGGSEFRLGGTWGHTISDEQRFKITGEHFAQQFDMKFVSGSNTQWAGENDLGLAYQYLIINNRWLQSINLGGYYTNAESESVGVDSFFTKQGGTFIDQKSFSGASTGNLYAGITVQPWQTGQLGLSLDYDIVRYSPDFVPATNNRSGLGAAVTFTQLLTSYLKLDLLASHQQPFDLYQAGVGWLIPSKPGTQWELNLSGSHLTGDIFTGTDNWAILSLGYSWGGSPDSPRSHYELGQGDLSQWTQQPAVSMPAVLIMKDEAVRPVNVF